MHRKYARGGDGVTRRAGGGIRAGRPRTAWPPAWSALADAAGGIAALAAQLGTTRRVLERWVSGDVAILGPARVAVRFVARDLGVDSPV